MDPARFTAAEFGRPVRGSPPWDFWSFEPAAAPRSVSLSGETLVALSEADNALGRLAGAGRLLPNPHLLVSPYVVREAVASSRIEGTQASVSEVFQAAAGRGRADADVREVQNYISAMESGIEQLTKLPISQRLIREIHATLMRGVRGREKWPGEFRNQPVHIGSPTDKPETAEFVPPLPHLLPELLADWERLANERGTIPPLVQCAILHYQFETIHPFLDGNGRLGRLLIVFFLVERARLPRPLLYISSYFEEHRREYYDRLQGVRENAEMEKWLQFFLTAVKTQADDAIVRAESLSDLRERYRSDLTGSRSRAVELVDLLLLNPVIATNIVQQSLDITDQGARNLIRHLEKRGWLQPLGAIGRGGRHYWLAPEILAIIEGEQVQAGTEQHESADPVRTRL